MARVPADIADEGRIDAADFHGFFVFPEYFAKRDDIIRMSGSLLLPLKFLRPFDAYNFSGILADEIAFRNSLSGE